MLKIVLSLTVIACVIAAFVIFCIVLAKNKAKYIDFVLNNSVTLGNLREINKKYVFYPVKKCKIQHIYDNKFYYNQISCKDYLTYQLQFQKKDVINQIFNAKNNKSLYDKYAAEVIAKKSIGTYKTDICKLKTEKLIKIEKRICNEYAFHPITEFCIEVELLNSKINGQIRECKRKTFNSAEIEKIINRLNHKTNYYYVDKDIWDAICRVERGKVSNKIRFAVYKKDGYRCCKCGAWGRYAQLEIDHIYPISKGGKSTFDNLQTLCHKCNTAKSGSVSDEWGNNKNT